MKMLDEVLNIPLQIKAEIAAVGFGPDEPASDADLVRETLAGDESAFAEIFERYKRPMTRVVSRFFFERDDIEELVQQCFTKTYFSLAKYRGGEERSFPAWMTRIAVNVCYDEFRRRGRRSESLFTEMSDADSEYIESIAEGRRATAEQTLTAVQLVEKIMNGLDARDRVAMTLVYSEDYSLDEAAGAIGITSSNLKSRLFRCRNHIRQRFGHLFK